jgi:hypothetical protein
MADNFLYDTDSGVNGPAKRTFTVTSSKPVAITAAGLADDECVDVYVRVGSASTDSECSSCHNPSDWLWTPLKRCGVAVQLCGSSNQLIELVPGTYMLGPVSPDPVFAGDVNITISSLQDLPVEVLCCLGKCEPQPTEANPLPVEVVSTCADPINVNVCNPTQVGIESSFAPLGCTVDGDGVLTGKVFLCKVTDDTVGATPSFDKVHVSIDGSVTMSYTGSWVDCSVLDACDPIESRGLVPSW